MINIKNLEPSKELKQYVRKISHFQSKADIKYKQKLTPSAFTYLSYNYADIPTSVFGKNEVIPDIRLQIAGPKNSDEIFVEYNGKLSQILIEFTASGFYYLFHSSPSKIVNRLSDLTEFIDPRKCVDLEKELASKEKCDDQIKLLEEFLIDRIYYSKPFIDYIEEALKIIEEHKGHVNINTILNNINIGKRQFDRKFLEVVGLPPKTYSKIIQLHYVIKIMQSKKYSSMQDISYQAEFYDLAHFTNRFKDLTGFTPNDFIKSDKHIALKYFTDLTD